MNYIHVFFSDAAASGHPVGAVPPFPGRNRPPHMPGCPLHELSVEAFFLQDKKSFSHHVPLFGPFDCVVGHCSLFPAARNQNFSIGRMAQSKRGCCAKPCTAAPFQVQIIIRRYDCLFRKRKRLYQMPAAAF